MERKEKKRVAGPEGKTLKPAGCCTGDVAGVPAVRPLVALPLPCTTVQHPAC